MVESLGCSLFSIASNSGRVSSIEGPGAVIPKSLAYSLSSDFFLALAIELTSFLRYAWLRAKKTKNTAISP